MYQNIETSIANNGRTSQYFKPQRGIRQGCPISMNIFVIIVEFLAAAIRKNPRVIGIKINGKMYKINQYADDTTIYVEDQHSLQVVLLMMDIFHKSSGIKMNREKSETIWIGASSNYRHKPLGLKWNIH
jgi:hypothetical protein